MPRVVAVTVTYGNRFGRLCRETIERAFAAGAAELIVVDNGSAPQSASALRKFAANHDGVFLVRNEENLGSARAFGAGLTRAIERSPDFIWLLDDDNWVESDVLETLLAAQAEEAAASGDDGIVVCARRVPNAFHDRVLGGAPVGTIYPPAGAFLGFDGLTHLRRKLRRSVSDSVDATRARIPYAPYGGTLVRPRVAEEAGMPNPDLILYVDDTAWTSRIVAKGHAIVLVASAVIEDAEGKWVQQSSENSVSASIRSSHLDRLYLSTRNRVWFDRSRVSTTGACLRYACNRLIVMAIAALSLFRTSSRRGYRVFRRAVWDAERGDFTREVRLSSWT